MNRIASRKVWLLVAVIISGCNSNTPGSAPAVNSTAKSAESASSVSPINSNAPSMPGPPADDLHPYVPLSLSGMLQLDNKGYFYMPAKWQTLAIPVCWESGAPAGAARTWVRDAITKSWQAHSALTFIGWGDCSAAAVGIRIAVRDVDSNDGPHTIGLGKDIDGKPAGMVLNFTFKTWSMVCASSESQRQSCIQSIGVHEFGHAIGFAHEQNRPDTPGECAMKQKPQGQSGDTLLTPFDPQSVMNYCNPVYNNNGVLSAGDISAVVQVYGSKT